MYPPYSTEERALHTPGKSWTIDGQNVQLRSKDAEITFMGTTAGPTEAERRDAAGAIGNYLEEDAAGDFLASDQHGVKRVYITKPVC